MAKKAKVWDGSAWQDLASATTDLTPYSTTAQMNTAIAASAGLTLINTTSFTTAATASINNCFTSLYSNYRIILNGLSSTDGDISFRLRVSGVDTITNYADTMFYIESGSGPTRITSTSSSKWSYLSPARTGKVVSSMDVYSPQESLYSAITWSSYGYSSSPQTTYYSGGGTQLTATQFDGFSLLPSLGTFTGTISVYGYKK